MSDTHSMHERCTVPPCDVLIHAGDWSGKGAIDDTVSFLQWFEAQPARHRIMIAGNHDWLAERHAAEFARMLKSYTITYLNDSGCDVDGLRVWGSPVQPEFCAWAFNRARGGAIRKHWDMIPNGVDVLVTHGPPAGIGDRTARGDYVGCADLMARLREVRPKLHVFGHIHEGRGKYHAPVDGVRDTVFVNASCLDETYRKMRQPVAIEL